YQTPSRRYCTRGRPLNQPPSSVTSPVVNTTRLTRCRRGQVYPHQLYGFTSSSKSCSPVVRSPSLSASSSPVEEDLEIATVPGAVARSVSSGRFSAGAGSAGTRVILRRLKL